MAVTGVLSDHWKYKKSLGWANFKAQSGPLSITFDNTNYYLTRSAGSFVTDGFAVGDKFYTNSANAANQGPFIAKAVTATTITAMTLAGANPTFTIGTETITVGTYLIKCILTRTGFVFNKAVHGIYKNINTSSTINATTNTITVSASAYTFTRASGSFLTDGFVVGNWVTTTNFTNAANNGQWKISAVTATVMTVTTTAGGVPTLTNETNTTVTNLTWVSNDELATANGYTQNAMLSGLITWTQDDVNFWANGTFPTVSWSAAGGSIGPSASMLLYNMATDDNTIIGNIDFGGDQTATTTTTFNVASGTVRDI